MIKYDILYSKFQLKDDDAEYLYNLHRFARACYVHTERVIVTSTITDNTGSKVLKKEVKDAELV